VSADAPSIAANDRALAIPVAVSASGETVELTAGGVRLVVDGQAEPVEVPLIPARTEPGLFVAVIPPAALDGRTGLRGYVYAQDEAGREGASEIFSVDLEAGPAGNDGQKMLSSRQ
jgi:hypothetical protein